MNLPWQFFLCMTNLVNFTVASFDTNLPRHFFLFILDFQLFCVFSHTANSSFKHMTILDTNFAMASFCTNLPWQFSCSFWFSTFLCVFYTPGKFIIQEHNNFLIQICLAKFWYKFGLLIMANFSLLVHGKFSLQFMEILFYWSWQFSLNDFFCHGKFQYESAMAIFLVHGKFSLREFRRGKFWYEFAMTSFLFIVEFQTFCVFQHTLNSSYKTRQFLIQICHAKFWYKFGLLIMTNFTSLLHGKFSLLIMAGLVFKSWKFSLHDFFCHGKFQYESAMPI